MRLLTFFFLAFSITPTLLAKPLGKIIRLSGEVYFDGKKVSDGFEISKPGKLETKADGEVKVTLETRKTTLLMKANSSVSITAPTEQKNIIFQLLNGFTRWIVQEKNSNEIAIETPSMVMGVRGTDFIAAYNPLLNESESICFDGNVELRSNLDKTDKKMIHQGQWGGVGGRYGKRIGDIITLPQPILDTFRKMLAP
ncbi:MAG: FecR domain-containing protein [Oligoflexales bacterium]|nr:FecR domain-containing protein [Oligoflexales bacterium]